MEASNAYVYIPKFIHGCIHTWREMPCKHTMTSASPSSASSAAFIAIILVPAYQHTHWKIRCVCVCVLCVYETAVVLDIFPFFMRGKVDVTSRKRQRFIMRTRERHEKCSLERSHVPCKAAKKKKCGSFSQQMEKAVPVFD
jgi:hypothetical protein